MRSTEIHEVAPTSLNHLLGQRSVIEQVQVAMDAAWADGKKFDHALLVGPPGVGKSVLAKVIALEMAGGFHEVLGQSITSPADLNALLLNAKEKDVVHIDECHDWRRNSRLPFILPSINASSFCKG
jgi:Holliday junction DNA helicase RuvB